ncbi:threonine-rich protein-like [Haliotis asinina]|uniref:threonine-rich protein-like n=1 Tax=Haliotis asinina TaxID=109174 RepID=UPI0035323548
MSSCCLIIHGIALILVVPLCSSFLLSGTVSDLNCLVCDEVHDLADCDFTEKRCRPNQACYLEVRGDSIYQRIKAGCGSVPTHCHHGKKRSDHDFCDYPVLCNGDCRDADSCNEYICNLPLYGHYQPTTTVKTATAAKTSIAIPSSTKEQTTISGTTVQVSTTQTLPASTATITKQPISTSGTKTVTASSTTGPSTNSDVSTTPASTPTAAVTSAAPPSSKQPISTSETTTQTATMSSDSSSTNNVATTNATVPQTTTGPTGVMCATCSGPMCGYSPIQPVVQCPDDAPYCMNSVANHLDASKTITKACATVKDCRSKWWHQTSDRSECTGLNVAVPVNDEFTCNFCCVKDDCNKPVVPALDSLFRG